MVVFCIHNNFPRHCVLLSKILGEPQVGLFFTIRQGGVAVDLQWCFCWTEAEPGKRDNFKLSEM